MSNVSNISVTLDLNSNQFQVGITRANKQVQTLNGQLGQLGATVSRANARMSLFGGTLRSVAVNMGIFSAAISTAFTLLGGGVLVNIVQVNMELERMQMLLQGMNRQLGPEGAIAQANKEFEYLIELSKQAPFELNALTNAFTKMKSAGIDPMAGMMQNLTDAVAAMGGDNQNLQRAAVAIQQMAGKGVISMEELRQQLGEAVPQAMALMARSMGVSVGELTKMIATGTVEAGDALRRMSNEFAVAFGGAARARMQTFEGALNNLKTEWKLFAQAVGETGFMESLTKATRDLSAALASDEGRQAAQAIGNALQFVIDVIRNLVAFIQEWQNELKAALAAFLAFKVVAAAGGVLSLITAQFLRQKAAMAGATTAAVGLRTAMALMGGPIMVAAAAVSAFVFQLWRSHEAAKAADEAYRDFLVTTSRGEFVEDAKQLEVMTDRLEKIRDTIRMLDAQPNQGARQRRIMSSGAVKALYEDITQTEISYQQWRDLVRNNYEDVERTIRGGEQTIIQALRTNERNKVLRDQNDAFIAQIEAFENEYVNAARRLDNRFAEIERNRAEAVESGDLNEDDATAKALRERVEAAEKYMGEFSQRVSAAIEGERGNIRRLKENADELGANGQRQLEAAQVQLDKLVELRNRARSIAENTSGEEMKLLPRMTGGEEGDKIPAAIQALTRLGGEVARYKAILEETNPRIAEFMAEQGLLEGMTPQIREEILARLEQVDALKKQVDARKALINANKDLASAEAQLRADLESAQAQLSGDVYNQLSSGMVQVRREIAGLGSEAGLTAEAISQISTPRVQIDIQALAQATGLGEEALREFVATAQRMIDIQNQIDLTNFTREMQELREAAAMSMMTDSDRAEAEHQQKLRRIREERDALIASGSDRVRVEQETQDAIAAIEQARQFQRMGRIGQMYNAWRDSATQWKDFWADSMQGASDVLTQFVSTGKADWGQFVQSMIEGMVRMAVQAMLTKLIMEPLMGMFGMTPSGGAQIPLQQISRTKMEIPGFAKGGVMSQFGQIHAGGMSGGIAKSPQLALFGEGSRPEAYVPLPDGKTIPVTMAGGGAPSVQVNVINQSGQPVNAEQGGMRFDGQQYVLDVVLQAMNRPGGFRDGVRNAMR